MKLSNCLHFSEAEDTTVTSGWTEEGIVGCAIGILILLIIIIVVAVKLYQYYKRKHSRVSGQVIRLQVMAKVHRGKHLLCLVAST